MEFDDYEHEVFVMFDSISLFQGGDDIIPVEVQDVFVDFDVLLVAAEEVQLVNFQVDAFLFAQGFDDGDYRLNDASFLFDLNMFNHLHDIVA